ncbi:MAG: CPBP family intramembrane metalloprotease [Lachnospiraceae bacterium]|nr:CPBP family intramembrane metalloprotease [Lachnospiraceae bacterium]
MEDGNAACYDSFDTVAERKQKDVKAVNITFLILATVPELLGLTGLLSFISSYGARLLISQILFVLPVVVYLICFKKSAAICRFKKIKISNLLLCFLFYICVFPVMMFLSTVSLLYSKNAISGMVLGITDELPLAAGLLIVAIIPAFCEEMTYRGVFYNTYREVNPLGAIFMSGILFGLLHANLNQISYAIALGIVFALLVEATDSIFASMIVHGLINSFSTVLIYLIPKAVNYLQQLIEEAEAAGDTMTLEMLRNLTGTDNLTVESFMGNGQNLSTVEVLYSIAGALIPASVGGALAFFLFRLIAKRCGRWEHVKGIFTNNHKQGKLITAPLIIAILFLVVVTFLNELVIRGIIG